jgi:hypothetical protein
MIEKRIFQPQGRRAGQRWTARQIDQATQEMSKFGVASAHAELAGAGLI